MHQPSFTVTLSDDEMTAWIRFYVDAPVPLSQLQRALTAAGVGEGIDTFLLEDLAVAHRPGESYCIARGSPAGGEIEYTFSLPTRRPPKRLPDGRIDFYNLSRLQHVAENQVLVRKVPLAARRPGSTVCGRMIPPSKRDVPLPRPGACVRLNDDGRSLIALTSGYPVLQNGVLSVDLVYTVEGDVGFSTGNLDCQGSVVVSGDIKDGFSIRAGESVTVHGVVNGGTIRSQGNINLYGNVFGKHQSYIVSDAGVQGIYLNESTVKARKDLRLLRGARHCELYAGGSIFVTDDEGHIIGGTAQAHNRVVTHHLGSEQAIPTYVEILSGTQDTATSLDYLSYIRAILAEDRMILKRGTEPDTFDAQYMVLHSLLQNNLEAIDVLSSYFKLHRPFLPISPLQNSMLVVTGTAYPGVRVKIGDHGISIKEKMVGVMFCEKNGQMHVQHLDQHNQI